MKTINFLEDRNMVPIVNRYERQHSHPLATKNVDSGWRSRGNIPFKTKIGVILLSLAAMLFIWGCEHSSDDIPTGVPTSVESLIESGWENFSNGNYTGAIDDFLEASSRDAQAIEAYLGMGWSYLRDGQYNIAKSKIDGVWSLISLGIITTPEDIDLYSAQSYACLAGVYSGLYGLDPETIPTNCALVVENVDSVLAIDPDFEFVHDPEVNAQSLKVTKADAQFAMSDFAGAFYTISEVDTALMKDTTIVEYIEDVSVLVQTLFDSTTAMGYARLTVPDAQFIDVVKVTDDQLLNSSGNLVEYSVAGFVYGGNQVTFYGTPVPQAGDYFLVTYYNAVDFIEFTNALRELIDNYR